MKFPSEQQYSRRKIGGNVEVTIVYSHVIESQAFFMSNVPFMEKELC